MSPLEIKAARLALGMNQREFAEALCLSGEATVRSWESGRRKISGPATVAIRMMLKHGTKNERENSVKTGSENGANA